MTHQSRKAVPSASLNDGQTIPQLGLGTWPMGSDEVRPAIAAAFDAGYRHFDTAAAYENEEGVGRAIRNLPASRDELFITTKIPNDAHGLTATRDAMDASLRRLRTEYVDLALIHWPMPANGEYINAWVALTKLRDAGKVRSIGVSNFQPTHLRRIVDATGVTPAVNQIQWNPYVQQLATGQATTLRGALVAAWAPLAPKTALLSEPVIITIAARHNRSAAQVVLRWHLQQQRIVIPKSATPARIQENVQVFDFTLSDEEMEQISALRTDGLPGYPEEMAGILGE